MMIFEIVTEERRDEIAILTNSALQGGEYTKSYLQGFSPEC
jgi:hypothetical protein